jgi:sirohydrochlorin cobaltochelatase
MLASFNCIYNSGLLSGVPLSLPGRGTIATVANRAGLSIYILLWLPKIRQPISVSFSNSTLVVLGHGTTLNDQSAAPVFQHAAELRRRKIFAEVREAFWKQEPQIKKVLAEISAPKIFIAPLFVSEGYFSAEIIPQELGFNFPENLKLKTESSEIFYCRPVGSDDSMTKVILSRAEEVVKKFPFPREPKKSDTTLFIAGHGTEKNKNSRKAIERQVELIRTLKIYADVHAIFMEESPRIAECYQITQAKNLVVVPFFISDGLHTQEDIPVLLGESERIVKERLAIGQPAWRNPTEKNGKLVWYSPAVGSDPGMADVILERVREAAGTPSIARQTNF